MQVNYSMRYGIWPHASEAGDFGRDLGMQVKYAMPYVSGAGGFWTGCGCAGKLCSSDPGFWSDVWG